MREEQRRKFYEAEIDEARNRLIKKHKLCGGTGFIKKAVDGDGFANQKVEICKCRKKFNLFSKFIISNI